MKQISFSLRKYDSAFNNFYNDLYDHLHLQDELLKRFPPKLMAHSGTIRWLSKPDVLEAPYRQHKNTTSGEVEIITKTDVLKFKEFLHDLIIPIRDKAKQHTIEVINQTCEATGNEVDAVNQDVWDAYIEAIEQMEMAFDDDGNPIFLIHPPKFYEKLQSTKPTIEQSNKVEEIFKKQKENYILKKGSRRLFKSSRKEKPLSLNENIDVTTLKTSLSLPKYNLSMIQLIREVKNGFENLDPILGEIRKVEVAHGGMTRQVSEPQILETPMKNYSAIISVELDCFLNTDTEQFRDALYNFSNEAVEQMKKHFFEVFPQICDATGNNVNAQGKNVWDAYLEMLETMEMSFDENGNHNTTLVVHPDTARKIRENPPTPEQIAKGNEIIERKKKEYYAQKRTRRLLKFNN
jgi:hypothetical protein